MLLIGVAEELVMVSSVEIEVIVAVEQDDHVRAVLQDRLIQIDQMMVRPNAGDGGIDYLEPRSREAGSKLPLQISVNGLGILEHLVLLLDMRPDAAQAVRSGPAHEENAVRPRRLRPRNV